MSVTLDRIIEEVRQLPPDEQRQLRELLDREAWRADETSSQQSSRRREQQWIATHRHEYTGEWVALEGDRLITHGHDARTVYHAAREAGIAVPFIVRVNPLDEPSMGGW